MRTAFVLLALAGCTVTDEDLGVILTPLGPNTYVFVTSGSDALPPDNKDAEAMRLNSLDDALSRDGVCPTGHQIIDRDVQREDGGLLGPDFTIAYTIRCTS